MCFAATRGRVQLVIYTIYTGLVQPRLCTADYALLTSYLVYHGSLRHLFASPRKPVDSSNVVTYLQRRHFCSGTECWTAATCIARVTFWQLCPHTHIPDSWSKNNETIDSLVEISAAKQLSRFDLADTIALSAGALFSVHQKWFSDGKPGDGQQDLLENTEVVLRIIC
jgi:hypothetical protein